MWYNNPNRDFEDIFGIIPKYLNSKDAHMMYKKYYSVKTYLAP